MWWVPPWIEHVGTSLSYQRLRSQLRSGQAELWDWLSWKPAECWSLAYMITLSSTKKNKQTFCSVTELLLVFTFDEIGGFFLFHSCNATKKLSLQLAEQEQRRHLLRVNWVLSISHILGINKARWKGHRQKRWQVPCRLLIAASLPQQALTACLELLRDFC